MVYSAKARGLMEGMEAIPKHRKLRNFDINAVPLLEMLVGTMIVATSLLSFTLLYLYGMEVDITIASFALCLENTVSDG